MLFKKDTKSVEIKSKRTYNQKVYDISGGREKYHIHINHIHYKNNGRFENIDTTLVFDFVKNTWGCDKTSYRLAIPEYADGKFMFYNAFEGIDHVINTIPQAQHIKGMLFNGQSDENYVLYEDAFGRGIDLKVSPHWSGVRKVIIIREKPSDIQDLHFDFELILPENADIIDKKEKKWDKIKELKFKDKTLRIGVGGKYSFFRKAKIWDSGVRKSLLRESIDIELYIDQGKIYLRKTIPSSILEVATYPLYTDHTTNYYAGAGDGDIFASDDDWNVCVNLGTGEGANDSGGELITYCNYDIFSPQYVIYRAFIPFDTSGIGAGNVIESAVLNIYGHQKYDDWNSSIGLVQTTQSSVSELVEEDYGNMDTDAQGSIEVSDFIIDDWNTIEMSDLSWIVKDGWTKLGLREYYDYIDSIPPFSPGTTSDIEFVSSEEVNSPYLEIVVKADVAALISRVTVRANSFTNLVSRVNVKMVALIVLVNRVHVAPDVENDFTVYSRVSSDIVLNSLAADSSRVLEIYSTVWGSIKLNSLVKM